VYYAASNSEVYQHGMELVQIWFGSPVDVSMEPKLRPGTKYVWLYAAIGVVKQIRVYRYTHS